MSDDKRKRERFPLTQKIELKTGSGSVIPAMGGNISEGGVLCLTETPLAEGESVTFMVTVPVGKMEVKVDCTGVVLRCVGANGKYSIGIQIVEQE